LSGPLDKSLGGRPREGERFTIRGLRVPGAGGRICDSPHNPTCLRTFSMTSSSSITLMTFIFAEHFLSPVRDMGTHGGEPLQRLEGSLILPVFGPVSKTVQTKDGNRMKFVSFEDTTGSYEPALFPKV